MNVRRSFQALALSLVASGAANAQTPDWVAVLLDAAMLPVSANAARNEGVPGNEIRAVLEAMRGKNVPAHEARGVLDEARNARRDHGPVDNFGAFVQSRLDAGLRGRDLAAAIRAEHAARGKGGAGGSKGAAARARADNSPAGAKGKSAAAGDSKGRSQSARDDSAKAARPTGKGKRPSHNR